MAIWTDEINKFAPSLKYYILHPSENNGQSIGEIQSTDKYELFITTYGMLSRYERLKNNNLGHSDT
jgi:non-specific serine/threonine protein kinase